MLSNYSKKVLQGIGILLLIGCQSKNLQPVENKKSISLVPAKLESSRLLKDDDINLDISKSLDLNKAISYVVNHSDKLLAAQAGSQASQLQADALDLHQPFITLGGTAGRHHIEKDVDITAIKERADSYTQNLTPQKLQFLQQIAPHSTGLFSKLTKLSQLGMLPQVPDSVHINKQDNFYRGHISAFLPIYTGGKIGAIQQFAQGRADSDATKILTTKEELIKTLIQRYFQVQLAEKVVKVRESALKAVQGHTHSAKRMFELGVISKIQKLQATSALADAKFQLQKAKDNLHLTQTALNTLLLQKQSISVATPLFISNKELASLSEFKTMAQQHYPIFAEIKAKRKQIEAMKELSKSAWKPNVGAFGSYQLGKDKNWMVGVNASIVLNNPVDRSKMYQAAKANLIKIDAIYRQAEKDINLYVEKNWLAVKDTKARYISLGEEEKLAQQVLKLHRIGFKQGVNTIVELNTAQTKLAKIQTQRANASYEYVMALAELLASTGNIQGFTNYIPVLK